MSEPIVFWRDGFSGGKSGAFVHGATLNAAVARFIADGVPIAGIVIDPENEANANEKALALGLETKQRILAEKGLDWREVARQRQAEKDFEASLAKVTVTEPTIPRLVNEEEAA